MLLFKLCFSNYKQLIQYKKITLQYAKETLYVYRNVPDTVTEL